MQASSESDPLTVGRIRRSAIRGFGLVSYLGLGISAYVLSTGPYVWLAENFDSALMMRFGELVYAPLIWLAGESEVFEAFIGAYLELFVDLFIKPY